MATTLPDTQYELMEVEIELDDRQPGTPVPLPAGWIPMQAVRRAGVVVVLLMREL